MRALAHVPGLLLLTGCIGWVGGVIPDTAPPDTVDSGDTHDSDPPVADPETPWRGTGADGPLEISDSFVIDDDVRDGREHPDAVHHDVEAILGTTITLGEDADGLAAGDEVLLINQRGTTNDYGSVGAWEMLTVASTSGETVELAEAPSVTFGETDNKDLGSQSVVLQRVPQYTSVVVADGATLTATAWNRSGGGIIALRSSEGISVQAGGKIDAEGIGYDGGETGGAGCDGYQGESYTGWGTGGVCGATYNESIGGYNANAGGGGCTVTDGGGGYGGYGHPGDAWTSGYTAPSGGETHGDEALGQLFMGSGGGGVWNGSRGTEGSGGDGGGIVLLTGVSITVQEGGVIQASGADTFAWSEGSYTYGAGGGAGGAIWLLAEAVELAEASVLATGGAGESSHERAGGDGGVGRVRVDCQSCNGGELGSAAATEALTLACEPDPGWSEVP